MTAPPTLPTVAFVGLGRMGLPMARRLAGAGYPISGFDAGAEAREAFAPGSPADVVSACAGADVVILMLPDSEAVADVLEGAGVLELLAADAVVVDMGSSEPTETRRLAGRAAQRGVRYVDAPVSGGVAGAERGALTIMVGGEEADVDALRPLLDILGGRVLHVGPAGAGHAVKALNNLLSATHLLATSEAMLTAESFGLDVAVVLDAINTSSGRSGSTERKWPDIVHTRSFDSGFSLRLMVKDMKTAARLAHATGRATPLAEAAVELWEQAAARMPAEADHTEIVRWLDHEDGAGPALAPHGNGTNERNHA